MISEIFEPKRVLYCYKQVCSQSDFGNLWKLETEQIMGPVEFGPKGIEFSLGRKDPGLLNSDTTTSPDPTPEPQTCRVEDPQLQPGDQPARTPKTA